MFLIIGLGNPGKEYKNTKHNLGFLVLDKISEKYSINISKKKFNSRIGSGKILKEEVLLVKPQTYMNNSGNAVSLVKNFYKIGISSIFVIYDDIDLPIGLIRIKKGGSSGGHKGMLSIINELGTVEIARIRIGIGRPQNDNISHVLSEFSKEDLLVINDTIDEAVEVLETMVDKGIETAMNLFNKRVNFS